MISNLREFGIKVKQYRDYHDLTQANLAAQMGCANSYISHIELGESSPALEFTFKLENVLGLPTRELSEYIIQSAYDGAKDASLGKKVLPITGNLGVTGNPGVSGVYKEGKLMATKLELRPEGDILSIPVQVNLPKEVYLKLELKS